MVWCLLSHLLLVMMFGYVTGCVTAMYLHFKSFLKKIILLDIIFEVRPGYQIFKQIYLFKKLKTNLNRRRRKSLFVFWKKIWEKNSKNKNFWTKFWKKFLKKKTIWDFLITCPCLWPLGEVLTQCTSKRPHWENVKLHLHSDFSWCKVNLHLNLDLQLKCPH